MNILLFLLLLFPIFGGIVDDEEFAPEQREWPAVTVHGNDGVIAPRHEAPDLVWSADPIDGYWLPGEEWLVRAEDAVLHEAAGISDDTRRPMEFGNRQYAGYIVNGERLIYINSMCAEIDGWRRSGVVVMDGGHCFWNATYNVDTDEIESLSVNGQA